MRPDFLGYTYCPVRELFRQSISEAEARYDGAIPDGYRVAIPNGHKGEDHWREIWQVSAAEQLPEVIASAGFSHFFEPHFMERFLRRGHFNSAISGASSRQFVEAGLDDPDGWYGVYAVFPLVMLVDKRRLGNRPVPSRWADLLDPCYEGEIAIGATQGKAHEDLMLYLYKSFGLAGVAALARNVRVGMHGAQMAKMAGSGSEQGAAIYIISWLFARCCARKEHVAILWPTDGALVTPMVALAKQECSGFGRHLFETVTGVGYGDHSARNCMPSRHGSVDNRLPEEATLQWLGWDFIKSHSIPELIDRVGAHFMGHQHSDFVILKG